MNVLFTMYVGTEYDKNNLRISNEQHMNARMQLEQNLIDFVSGFTLAHMNGAWKNSEGDIQKEISIKYEITADRTCLPDIIAIANEYKKTMNQDCVLLNMQELPYSEFI